MIDERQLRGMTVRQIMNVLIVELNDLGYPLSFQQIITIREWLDLIARAYDFDGCVLCEHCEDCDPISRIRCHGE